MAYSRRRTRIGGTVEDNDWIASYAGVVIARVTMVRGGPQGGTWQWSGQWYEPERASNGYAESLEAALEAIKQEREASIARGFTGFPAPTRIYKYGPPVPPRIT